MLSCLRGVLFITLKMLITAIKEYNLREIYDNILKAFWWKIYWKNQSLARINSGNKFIFVYLFPYITETFLLLRWIFFRFPDTLKLLLTIFLINRRILSEFDNAPIYQNQSHLISFTLTLKRRVFSISPLLSSLDNTGDSLYCHYVKSIKSLAFLFTTKSVNFL
jgi:hypothetical protein